VELGGWRPVTRGDIMGSWATARPPRHCRPGRPDRRGLL